MKSGRESQLSGIMKSAYLICRYSIWNPVWKVRAPHPSRLTSVCIRREIAPVKTNPAAHRGSLLGGGGGRQTRRCEISHGKTNYRGWRGREELTLSHNSMKCSIQLQCMIYLLKTSQTLLPVTTPHVWRYVHSKRYFHGLSINSNQLTIQYFRAYCNLNNIL